MRPRTPVSGGARLLRFARNDCLVIGRSAATKQSPGFTASCAGMTLLLASIHFTAAAADAPPSFDGHRESTYATVHSVAPFYSVLIRINPENPASTTDFVCDLCT